MVVTKVELDQVGGLVGEDKKEHGSGDRSQFWCVKNEIYYF